MFFQIKAVMYWRESRKCTSEFSKKKKNKNDEGLSYSAECFSVTSVHVFFKRFNINK